MLAYAAVAGAWHIPRVLLMSTNRHISLAYWSLAVALSSLGLAWILGFALQLNGVALAMLLSELLIAITCAWLACAAIADSQPIKTKAIPQ
jgi:type III secretory pathway component EscR